MHKGIYIFIIYDIYIYMCSYKNSQPTLLCMRIRTAVERVLCQQNLILLPLPQFLSRKKDVRIDRKSFKM